MHWSAHRLNDFGWKAIETNHDENEDKVGSCCEILGNLG